MIKLVATDIDGTVLGASGEYTSGVKNCITRLCEGGIKVVLATGRMHSGAKRQALKLGLNTPVVSYQGGMIMDVNGNILYESCVPESTAKNIIEWGRSNGVHLNLYADDVLYSEKDDYEIKRYSSTQQLDYVIRDFMTIPLNRVHKLLAIDYKNPDKITKYVDEMQQKMPELYIIKSTRYFCEFSTKNATKYCAVKFLQKYWNLNDDEILTIGDHDNDIELLKAGGISIAMGNGTDTLKQYADYITDSVENDGFVKAIDKFVFNTKRSGGVNV